MFFDIDIKDLRDKDPYSNLKDTENIRNFQALYKRIKFPGFI